MKECIGETSNNLLAGCCITLQTSQTCIDALNEKSLWPKSSVSWKVYMRRLRMPNKQGYSDVWVSSHMLTDLCEPVLDERLIVKLSSLEKWCDVFNGIQKAMLTQQHKRYGFLNTLSACSVPFKMRTLQPTNLKPKITKKWGRWINCLTTTALSKKPKNTCWHKSRNGPEMSREFTLKHIVTHVMKIFFINSLRSAVRVSRLLTISPQIYFHIDNPKNCSEDRIMIHLLI